ncbi:MAG: hypothetical protein ACLQOO_37610 [Terriglobia bacterium]
MSDLAPPKLAAIVTAYFKYSHAQHLVDRLLDGYGWNGTHHYPPTSVVSLYVDQVGSNDPSREREWVARRDAPWRAHLIAWSSPRLSAS